jgi:hypothetical protein
MPTAGVFLAPAGLAKLISGLQSVLHLALFLSLLLLMTPPKALVESAPDHRCEAFCCNTWNPTLNPMPVKGNMLKRSRHKCISACRYAA